MILDDLERLMRSAKEYGHELWPHDPERAVAAANEEAKSNLLKFVGSISAREQAWERATKALVALSEIIESEDGELPPALQRALDNYDEAHTEDHQ